MNTFWKVITRKKVLDSVAVSESQLARVLNTFDLTALGVGSTLGVGVYVLAGHIAKDTAGPSVVLSFLIAAIASVFAGLCYAEFGARVPRAGSAYIYSYVCVGELVAFVIGWNLILEYVIGSASVARGLTLYLDTLTNNTLKNTFIEIAPINISFMSPYFDFFSFGLSFLLSVGLAFGMKESSVVNNIFTILNIGVVLFVIIGGSIKADLNNWNLPAPDNSTENGGNGGFFPFGIEGMIKGAATCFYGFVGFDCIATTGEEVRNPQKAIPMSIILSLFIIFLSYFGTSTVITLMVPYYLQDRDAPIPHAFAEIGWEWAKWIVAIGGLFGLFASLFGAMFPLPRIIYAMASDGLVFRSLGIVNARYQTPVIGTILAGLLTGLMAAIFDLKQLVNMMSIGTLLAYTIVAACVLLLRYSKEEERRLLPQLSPSDSENEVYSENVNYNNDREELYSTEDSEMEPLDDNANLFVTTITHFFNFKKLPEPTKVSERVVIMEIFMYCILCLLIGLCALYLVTPISHGYLWAIILASVVGGLLILVLMAIASQPTNKTVISFKVPLVPLIPALSILFNIYLMLMLDTNTWIRFGVWMALGLPIYFLSVWLYPKTARNSSLKKHTNGNIVSNGHVNHSFTSESKDKNEDNKISVDVSDSPELSKKNHAPPPPIVQGDSVKNALSMDLCLALAALDDVLSDEEDKNRKISVGTMSNCSVHEENVVALVHREDEISYHKQISFERSNDASVDNKLIENVPAVVLEIVASTEDTENNANELIQKKNLPVPKIEVNGIIEKSVADQDEQHETLVPKVESNIEANVTDLPDTRTKEDSNHVLISKSNPVLSINVTAKEVLPSLSSDESAKTFPASEENKDTSIDQVYENSSPIPPPLPLLNLFDSFDVTPTIPRVTITDKEYAVLKPVRPKTPPADYIEPKENNLAFGSPEHVDFKAKLNNIFKKGFSQPSLYPVTSKKTPTENGNLVQSKEHVQSNELVDEDRIEIDEAKKNLQNFLQSPSWRPNGIVQNHFPSIKSGNTEPQSESVSLEGLTPEKPGEDSSNKFERINKTDPEKVEHRRKMAGTLKSIRLRKVDSFRNED